MMIRIGVHNCPKRTELLRLRNEQILLISFDYHLYRNHGLNKTRLQNYIWNDMEYHNIMQYPHYPTHGRVIAISRGAGIVRKAMSSWDVDPWLPSRYVGFKCVLYRCILYIIYIYNDIYLYIIIYIHRIIYVILYVMYLCCDLLWCALVLEPWLTNNCYEGLGHPRNDLSFDHP